MFDLYTNQTFCTMSFNRKFKNLFFGECFETERPCLFVCFFVFDISVDFKARASAQAAHGQFTLGSHLNKYPKVT